MRVMVLVKADDRSEAGVQPDPTVVEAMGRYNEELVNAGVLLAADALHPSASGARVRFDGATRSITDGPFAESRDLVAGYWIWQVRSLDEAIEWLRRAPFSLGTEVEIRPVLESTQGAHR